MNLARTVKTGGDLPGFRLLKQPNMEREQQALGEYQQCLGGNLGRLWEWKETGSVFLGSQICSGVGPPSHTLLGLHVNMQGRVGTPCKDRMF